MRTGVFIVYLNSPGTKEKWAFIVINLDTVCRVLLMCHRQNRTMRGSFMELKNTSSPRRTITGEKGAPHTDRHILS